MGWWGNGERRLMLRAPANALWRGLSPGQTAGKGPRRTASPRGARGCERTAADADDAAAARRAAVTPASASSKTTQARAGSPSPTAARRNISGLGLVRGMAFPSTMASSGVNLRLPEDFAGVLAYDARATGIWRREFSERRAGAGQEPFRAEPGDAFQVPGILRGRKVRTAAFAGRHAPDGQHYVQCLGPADALEALPVGSGQLESQRPGNLLPGLEVFTGGVDEDSVQVEDRAWPETAS